RVSARRHGGQRLCLRPGRAAGAAAAAALPHRPHPTDRDAGLRVHSVCRTPPEKPHRQGLDHPLPPDPEAHHPRAGRSPAGGRPRGVPGRPPGGERGGGLMFEQLEAVRARYDAITDRLEKELKAALVPKDPNDDKDVIVEIRQGTGGDEAALFAADLLRMYSRYAESRRWKVELVSESITERGGFKEVIFEVRGRGAY